ncbi:MAG: MFS transporter [Pedobacter sp.]|nr:MFS transporter [Pedobacter sp.]MDQ8054551.1 MFS transporter [Pedobacter sp.]
MARKVLPVIVISQFFCTSLWFAGNAVMGDIAKQFHLSTTFLAYLTSAVQLGFICGTLIFAILGISDRFSPVKVFFTCAIIAACCNLGVVIDGINAQWILCFRFLTGFFLAGIYPVGMKIAADHEQQGLGRSLGFLVGALVFGTSFPHLLKSMAAFSWPTVIYATTALAICGGVVLLTCVPDGPHRKIGKAFSFGAFLKAFGNSKFRSAAFGYFGHQWELYAFWVFIPLTLADFKAKNPLLHLNIPLLSFTIIGIGSLTCIISGLISQRLGTKRVASIALAISGGCCLLSPLVLSTQSFGLLIAFLLIWGMTVVADSPLYSTLIAQNATPELRGTALTTVTCIGFAITILSIQLLGLVNGLMNMKYLYLLLAPGPILGLIGMAREGKGKK